MHYPPSIENLISQMRQLPGVGPKSAERFVVHLLRMGDGAVAELIAGLEGIRERIVRCAECGMFADDVACAICSDRRRDRATICVVAEPADLLAIERTREYHGVYHILNGLLAPIEGVGPEQLRINELVERVSPGVIARSASARDVAIPDNRGEGTDGCRVLVMAEIATSRTPRNDTVTEVIFAFDPTIEGETTMTYLAERLAPSGVRMSRIARGLPVGGDLEYADPITLTDAMAGRRELPRRTEAPSIKHQIPNNIQAPILKH